ncbi:MAG: PIN domain-containing protein [Parachlamydia sp.]|nr:PIN domain-containing protein [Parachlamydia sp.]
MNYLLNTCVLSDLFRKIPSVIKHFEDIASENINVSSITVMEIEYGLKLNPEREKKVRPVWKKLLDNIHVVSFSPQCACAAASIRAILKVKGLSIGPYDSLLAGTCLAHDMIMVTSNLSEFNRVPKLSIEDWRI